MDLFRGVFGSIELAVLIFRMDRRGMERRPGLFRGTMAAAKEALVPGPGREPGRCLRMAVPVRRPVP